jgi:hypothetical protein
MFIKHKDFEVIFLCLLFFLINKSANAQFTPGNIVLLRVGNGSTTLSSAANPVSLVEYSTSGTPTGYSVSMPTSVSGSNRILTQSGSSTSEGDLSLSVNKQYLVLCGYDAAVGTSSVATTGNHNGVIGRVDVNGNINTSTYFLRTSSNAYINNNFRSVCSKDGSAYWASGASSGSNGGVRYITHGTAGSAGTQLSTTITNTRTINIFNNQLYATSGSGSYRMTTVGSGTPTTSGNTITNMSGMPTSSFDPYAFVFLDRDSTVSGVDVCYMVSLGGSGSLAGIFKYSYNGTTWTNRGSITGYCRGLTAMVNCAGEVDLYITVSSSSNAQARALHKITDNAAYNANISATSLGTAIATSGSNYSFGGIAFAPENNLTITSTQTVSAGTYSKIKINNGGIANLSGNIRITDSLIIYDKGILNCNDYVVSSATNFSANFILKDSGTLKIGNINGITQTTNRGNIQTCKRVYSKDAFYEYSGSSAQVTGDGLPNEIFSFKINNSEGLTLSKNLSVKNKLLLSSGLLKTTDSNILKLRNTATVVPDGGSISSYVNGPMDWEMLNNTERLFPIGKDTIWGKCGIEPFQSDNRGTPNRVYRCEFIDSGYGDYSINTLQSSPLNHVSELEYWLISEQTGASGTNDDVNIKLYWSIYSNVDANASSRQDLAVVHFFNSAWNHEGSSPTILDNGISDGFVQSDWVQSFSPFTLGSFSSLNPLPINLLELKTECIYNATKIIWQTTNETDIKNYIIEKWLNSGFIEIGIVKANNSKYSINHYFFNDMGIQNNFIYRLIEELQDGTRNLIREFETDCKTGQIQKISLIQKGQEIEINSKDYRGKLNFQLINNLGQIIYSDSFYRNTVLNTQFLNSGIYVLNIPELQLSFKIIL